MPVIRNPEQYQLAAVNIAARARTDRTFYETLLRDPVTTLKSEGFGTDAVRELLSEDAFSRDRVSASGGCEQSCLCASNQGCCVTCWFVTSSTRSIQSVLDNPNLVNFGGLDPALQVNPNRAQLVNRLVDKGHLFPNLK